MTVLSEKAWEVLFSGGGAVGDADVVAVVLLMRTGHCAIEVSEVFHEDNGISKKAN